MKIETLTVDRVDARQAAIVEHITATWRSRKVIRCLAAVPAETLWRGHLDVLDRAEEDGHHRCDHLARTHLEVDRVVSWWGDPHAMSYDLGKVRDRLVSSTAPIAELFEGWHRIPRADLPGMFRPGPGLFGVVPRRPIMLACIVEATVLPVLGERW